MVAPVAMGAALHEDVRIDFPRAGVASAAVAATKARRFVDERGAATPELM